MSQQIINIGSSAGAGDGDDLRTAFDKTNKNFAEIYSGNVVAGNVVVYSVAGRQGNVVLTAQDVLGAVTSVEITELSNTIAAANVAARAYTDAAVAGLSTVTNINLVGGTLANVHIDGHSWGNVANLSVTGDQLVHGQLGVMGVLGVDGLISTGTGIQFPDNTQQTTAFLGFGNIFANALQQSQAINAVNANVAAANAAIASLASIDTVTINANIAAANSAIRALESNAGVQSTAIALVNANVLVANAAIAVLRSNAAVQATEISGLRANITAANAAILALNSIDPTSINANIAAANVAILALQANAGAQAQLISAVNANVAAANLAINTLTGNLALVDTTIYVAVANAPITLQPDSSANVYVGAPNQNNDLVLSRALWFKDGTRQNTAYVPRTDLVTQTQLNSNVNTLTGRVNSTNANVSAANSAIASLQSTSSSNSVAIGLINANVSAANSAVASAQAGLDAANLTLAGHTSSISALYTNAVVQSNAIALRATIANPSFTGTMAAAGDVNIVGNVVSGNVATGKLTASSAAVGSITATTIYASTVDAKLATGTQYGITGVGTLANLTVTGNVTAGNVITGNVITPALITGAVTATTLTGTLITPAQTNITKVGTLGNLTVTDDIVTGNLTINNTLNARVARIITQGLTANLATANVANVVVGNITTLSASSVAVVGNVVSGNVVSGIGSFNTVGGLLITPAQPNITVVGTLTGLSLSGNLVSTANASFANTVVARTFNANLVGATYVDVNNLLAGVGTFGSIVGPITTPAQPNITKVGTLVSLNIAGDIATGGNILVSVAGGNVSAPLGRFTDMVGTLSTSAQPNITSLGTLTGLTVNGPVNIQGSEFVAEDFYVTGNLFVSGNTTSIDAVTVTTNDLLLTLANNAVSQVATNGAGILIGNAGAYGNLTLHSGKWISPNDFNLQGNVSVGNLAAAQGTFNSVQGTLITPAQTNITSVGTLSTLAVSGNVTGGNVLLNTNGQITFADGTVQNTSANNAVSGVINAINANVAAANVNIATNTQNIALLNANVAAANATIQTVTQSALVSVNANVAAANVEIGKLQSNIAAANVNIGTNSSNIQGANAAIAALQANVTAANAAIVAANSALQSYVDYRDSQITSAWTANAAAQEVEINGLRANITAANTNISTNTQNISAINANVAAANAAIAAIGTGSLDSINANVTAANAAIASLQSNIAAANVNIGNNTSSIQAVNANVAAANVNIGTNSAGINSLATGANANTAAYLTSYTGNIAAGNVTVGYTLSAATIALTGSLGIPQDLTVTHFTNLANARTSGNLVVGTVAEVIGNLTTGNTTTLGTSVVQNLSLSDYLATNANATIGTTLSVQGADASTDPTQGALTVAGGVGVGGNIQIAGNANVAQNLSVYGTTALYGEILLDYPSIQSANSYVTLFTETPSQIDIGLQAGQFRIGQQNGAGNVYVMNGLNVTANLHANANAFVHSTADSVGAYTGALQVFGGAWINSNLFVSGNTVPLGNLNAQSNVNVSGNLTVAGTATFYTNANVGGNLFTTGNVVSANVITGNVFTQFLSVTTGFTVVAIDNTPIGQNIPSAGSFTTMTAKVIAPQYQRPNQRATLNLNLANAGRKLDPRISFSRGSTGTFVDYTGNLVVAGANDVRWHHEPTDVTPRGIFVEESRTNILPGSNAFTNSSYWLPIGSAITATTNTISPTGNNTDAAIITEDSTTGVHGIFVADASQPTLSAGAFYTASAFVRAGARSQFSIVFGSPTVTGAPPIFDLVTGTVYTEGTNYNSSIKPYRNGWYRIHTSVTTASTGGNVQILAATGGTINYSGTSSLSGYVFGAQVEAGPFPTSYIPTTVSSVTRNAEVVRLNDLSWYDGQEGMVLVDAYVGYVPTPKVPNNQRPTFLSFEGATPGTDRIVLSAESLSTPTVVRFANLAVYAGGTLQANVGGADPVNFNSVTSGRVAAYFKNQSFALTTNGNTTVNQSLSGLIPAVSSVLIGSGTMSNYLNGTISKIMYFPRTAATGTGELIGLTVQ